VRFRFVSVAGLAVCAALVLSSCGGSPKPRPDILFVSTRTGVYDIFAMNADGSRQKRLTHGSSGDASSPQGLFYELDPAWSLDGRSIAFASQRDNGFGVYVMDASGKNIRRLGQTPSIVPHPTWSPDGKRIAFVSGSKSHLEVMNANGRGRHRVTSGSAVERDPAWSPDGRWIAYSQDFTGTPVREIWLVHPNGTGRHQLTFLAASADTPAWSPDSKRLAFSSDTRTGQFTIYTIRVDGIGLRRLTTSPNDEIDPAWSPDGKTIAFARDGAIVTVSVTGTDEHVLTNGKGNDSSPVWNPIQAAAKAKANGS
jgi:tol-pal system beta propeller repeat protein TolB